MFLAKRYPALPHVFFMLSFCVLLFAQQGYGFANQKENQTTIKILPAKIQLFTTEARQLLIVQKTDGQQYMDQADSATEFKSSNQDVVRVENNFAIPVGNGKATITIKHGNLSASAEVTVSGQDKPFTWSFRNHVEPVLSKSGCNSGACHGARAGKKGFRLTLFGYDVAADHSYLTRQARGRRIVPSDPGRSLILTKPTGAIPHKGGVRFDPQSLEYRVLAEWIAAGTPAARQDDPRIERLEVLPKYALQQLGNHQQLVVLAHFNDGHVEDVTRWAKYTSVDMSVASVDDRGAINITGSGEGAIKVWYLTLNEMAFLSVPFPNKVSPDVFSKAEQKNFIDRLVLAKLASLNVPPSPLADDATFLRRAYLDTIGTLPTPEEVRRFLEDKSPDKKDRLVDYLLSRPEYVDYWAYKWSDLLLVSGAKLRPKAVVSYYQWIRKQVEENKPWDEFCRDIVTAKGSTLENGAANFYALHQDPEDMAETVSQAFLGLSIVCARCHNHPLEKWTNDQYYGMANLFARVRGKGWGGDFRKGDGDRIIFSDTQGELLQPSMGKPQPPRPLDGQAIAFDMPTDRRIHLAQWLTSPKNPYFSKSITNRIWANFFGVGLVEKIDDMRLTNPASNQELLDEVSAYLVEQRFDLKELMRTILQSSTYRRASLALPENKADQRFYSRYYPRRLKAEILLDAVSKVTNVSSQFKDQKKGSRAIQLADSNVESYFLSIFGRPERLITCDCERSDEPSMTQVLHLYNGKTINDKLASKGNRIDQLIEEGLGNAEIIDEAYLSSLSRLPLPKEKEKILKVFSGADSKDRRLLLEDFYWSLLSSREFLFNH